MSLQRFFYKHTTILHQRLIEIISVICCVPANPQIVTIWPNSWHKSEHSRGKFLRQYARNLAYFLDVLLPSTDMLGYKCRVVPFSRPTEDNRKPNTVPLTQGLKATMWRRDRCWGRRNLPQMVQETRAAFQMDQSDLFMVSVNPSTHGSPPSGHQPCEGFLRDLRILCGSPNSPHINKPKPALVLLCLCSWRGSRDSTQ